MSVDSQDTVFPIKDIIYTCRYILHNSREQHVKSYCSLLTVDEYGSTVPVFVKEVVKGEGQREAAQATTAGRQTHGDTLASLEVLTHHQEGTTVNHVRANS